MRPLLKGRIGVVHGSVMEYLTPFHLQLETSSRDDIQEDAIVKQVKAMFLTWCQLIYCQIFSA